MQEDGIGVSVHYPIPIHLQDAFRDLKMGEGSFPVAERLSKQIISLPLCPYLREEEQDFVLARLSYYLADKC